MEIATIDGEIFLISKKLEEYQWNFQKKILLMIILRVTKSRFFILSLEDTFFKKRQGRDTIDPPAVLGLWSTGSSEQKAQAIARWLQWTSSSHIHS